EEQCQIARKEGQKIMLSGEIKERSISILREEWVPATGCTEPIALAYAAAKMREILGTLPERVEAEVSGNIIKNVKSVIVPNTGGLKGIPAAIAAGIVAGDAGRSLQVIASVSEKKQREIAAYLQTAPISVIYADTPLLLDIRLTGWGNGHSAAVRIAGTHSNIVLEKRDGESLRKKEDISAAEENQLVEPALTVADI